MQNLSNEHFDIYLPYEDELTITVSDDFDNIPSSQKHAKKRRKRFTKLYTGEAGLFSYYL